MIRRSSIVIAVLATLVLLASGGPSQSPPAASAAPALASQRQDIGDATIRRLPSGRQQLRFRVSHARAGRAPGRARVRVTVFDNRFRNRVRWSAERRIRPSWRAPTTVAVQLPKSVRVRDLRAVTIGSYHVRPLARVRGIRRTHTQVVGGVAAEERGPVAPAGVAADGFVGGKRADLTVVNQTDLAVRLTAAPTTCMYDNGNSGSYLSKLNGVTLPARGSITQPIRADANTGHELAGQYKTGPAGDAKDRSPYIDPDFANALYSPSVRGFMFTAINKYTTTPPLDADPQTYNAIQRDMPGVADLCSSSKHLFAIGANQFLTGSSGGTTGAWRAHAAALVELKGTSDLELRAPLYSGTDTGQDFPDAGPRISVAVSGETITISQAGAIGGDTCTGGPDWMRCQFPGGSAKEATPLYNVAFPGSHDSITGSLMSHADWLDTNKSSSQSGGPVDGWCSSYVGAYRAVAPVVYNVSATQTLTIADQLDAGVRYLDLRSAYATSKNMSGTPAWRPLHTMYAQTTVATEAQTVASWARAHPDEVVIADFNHVCPNGAADGTDGLIEALRARDPVTGTSLCDVAFTLGSGAHMPALPAATVRQARAQGRNVIVLLDGSQRYDADLLDGCGAYPGWDQTQSNAAGARGNVPINHLWPDNGGPGFACSRAPKDDQSSADAIQSFPLTPSAGLGTSPTLADYRTVNGTNNPSIPFMQAQTQYTLDVARVIEDAFGCGTLLHWESVFIDDLRTSVLTDTGSPYGAWSSGTSWRDLLNVVIGDGVDGRYVATVAGLNSLSTRSCQVTDPATNPPTFAPCG